MPPRKRHRGAWLTLLAVAIASGCAHYSTSAGLVGGIRTVAIPVADNQTSQVDIGQRLGDRATEAFLSDGRLRVVDEETADARLQLRVVRLEDEPFTFTAAEVTEQYRFRLTVDALLERAGDGSELLRLDGLAGWGTYDAALPDDEGRDPAVGRAMDMVIEEIVDRATASW